jgi:hypothetical protein
MPVSGAPKTDHAESDGPLADPAFRRWRRVHRSASFTLGALATVHAAMTVQLYDRWSADAVWFLGTGLGLLLLAGMNLAHVGLEPCRLPTAAAVRAANWVFVVFGVGAFVAVPEPQAAVIVAALALQAAASHRTLPRAA